MRLPLNRFASISLAALVLTLLLNGCGSSNGKSGGSGGSGGGGNSSTYTIGGSISGLTAAGLTLKEATSGQTLSPVAKATSFAFASAVASGASYSVAVSAQPTGETCTVTNGSGTVASANITNIQVSCAANPTYTIGGSITGLTAAGLTLTEATSGQTLSPAANATSFAFASAVASGANYSVAVSAQPTGETCTVTNGSGTVASANITNIQVSCVANPIYTIGGSITGLTAAGLTLTEATSGQTLSPVANATSFAFASAVASGASYSVAVSAQPTGETCTVTNGSGTVASANITNIQVSCASNQPASKLTGYLIDAPVNGVFYQASPSGLSGTTLNDGSFTYQSGDTINFTVLGVSLSSAAGQSSGTAVPPNGIITPFTIANETPSANNSGAPIATAIATFLQTLSNVASGTTGAAASSAPSLLIPSGSSASALIEALSQQTASSGSTLIETIVNNLPTIVGSSAPVASPSTALTSAYDAALASSNSQTAAGQAYANTIWKVSGCSSGSCDLYAVLLPNGMIAGINADQNVLFGGYWNASGGNLQVNLLAPGGGSASATLAGGATSATLTITPAGGTAFTATIAEDTGAGGAVTTTNSGLWYANYTPVSASDSSGQGIFILAPDGTVIGITSGNSTLAGTWTGTSANVNLSNGGSCTLDLSALTGSCTTHSGNQGTLVLSRTALPLPALSASQSFTGNWYINCPGCGGNTPSTGTYSASLNSSGSAVLESTSVP